MEKAKQSLKEYVKEQYGKELSDVEAAKFLEELRAEGAISEEELERVAAGGVVNWGDFWGRVDPPKGGVKRVVIVAEKEGK